MLCYMIPESGILAGLCMLLQLPLRNPFDQHRSQSSLRIDLSSAFLIAPQGKGGGAGKVASYGAPGPARVCNTSDRAPFVLQWVMSTILHVLSRAKAEELAKAQYAERRDPHVCALLYIALGKKSLLQGAAAVACETWRCLCSWHGIASGMARRSADPFRCHH